MVLILDHTRSERALELRRRILDLKIPCAVSAVWSCGELLPPLCIITFSDVLEKICRAPLEKYKIFVLKDTWINSALPVIPCATQNELLQNVMETVYDRVGIQPKQMLDGALILPYGFLLTPNCLFYRCFPLKLSATETNILLMFLLTKGVHPAKHLTAYCFPELYRGNASTSASASIYQINKTAESQCGVKLISFNRKNNGYTLHIRVTKEI